MTFGFSQRILIKASNIKFNAEIFALLACYAASSGNPLPTFRDVLVSSSRSLLAGLINIPAEA
jgi:hypothetical protein